MTQMSGAEYGALQVLGFSIFLMLYMLGLKLLRPFTGWQPDWRQVSPLLAIGWLMGVLIQWIRT